jgi:hypothetical protein
VLGFNQGGAGVAIGGFFSGTTATAPTAGTFTTDAVNLPANSVVGQMIVTTSGATRFGIVQSNTSATNSVLTIDRWYDATALPADPGVAAASTPTAGAWICSAATPRAPTWRWRTTRPRRPGGDGHGADRRDRHGERRADPQARHVRALRVLGRVEHGDADEDVDGERFGLAAGHGLAARRLPGRRRRASRMFTKTALSANATMTTSGDQVQVTDTVTVT